jgi:hypothetical protein
MSGWCGATEPVHWPAAASTWSSRTFPPRCSSKGARRSARLCAPGGSAVLAGFLREDAAEIASVYNALGTAATLFDGDWAALVIEAAA